MTSANKQAKLASNRIYQRMRKNGYFTPMGDIVSQVTTVIDSRHLATMDHNQLSGYIRRAVDIAISGVNYAYGENPDCSNVPHPHPPTISNVRRIAGEGVTEQDHIKVLAANVMYRNMLVMGDI